MISWIQKYFQRHFRLVFGLILVAMAVPLVVIYSQSSGLGRAAARSSERLFYGYDLSNEGFMNRAVADAYHSSQLKGDFQADAGQIQQYALLRLAALALADRLHLPVPTEKDVSAYIASLPVFRATDGSFDQKRYGDFSAARTTDARFSVADANRVFRDDSRIESVDRLLRGPGYVLPADVQDILNHTDSKWTIDVASLDYAAFKPAIDVSEEALKKYFDDNAGRYEVGPRVKLSEVVFRPEDFAPPGAPTEEQMRAFYAANASRFPVPAGAEQKTPDLKADPAKAAAENFPKVRAQVEAAMRHDAAMQVALKAATDFTVALYESKAPANSPELTAFLAGHQHPAVALPPFSPEAPPADLEWTSRYADAIDHLDKDRYFSDPLTAPTGVVVLLWNDTLPAYQPLLAEARAKVVADYKDGEKRKAFVAEGQIVRSLLQAALKAGTPFAQAAAAQKLEVKSYAGFTLAAPPKDAPAAVLQSLASLNAGQVGEMIASSDKGYLVYVAQRQPPDLTPANLRFSEIKAAVAGYISEAGENAILSSLVSTELQKTAADRGPR